MSPTPQTPDTPARRFTDVDPGKVTVIPLGLSLEGELACGEALEVKGRIRGPLTVAGLCHLHQTAWVAGAVEAGDLVVEGEIEGPLKARGKVELRATARVRGDIEADSVALAEGCYFEGHIHMPGGPRAQPTSFHEKRAPRPSGG